MIAILANWQLTVYYQLKIMIMHWVWIRLMRAATLGYSMKNNSITQTTYITITILANEGTICKISLGWVVMASVVV